MMEKNNNKGPGAGQDDPGISVSGDLAGTVVDTVREPLVILDGDLRVMSANRSFYDVFKVKPGRTEKELIYDIGNRQWDIPELRRLLEEIIPKHASFDDFEVRHDFPDIGRRIMLLNARRIPRPPQKPRMILLAIEDITERRRLEDMLETSEERYRGAFETAHDGMLLVDKVDGRILSSNEAAQELLGYSHESFSERKIWDIGMVEDEAAFREAAPLLEKNGFIFYVDTPVRTSEGREISADIYLIDRAKVIQCSVRDITGRKKIEEETKRARDEYRDIANLAQDIIGRTDRDGKWIFLNDYAYRFWGYTEEDMIGTSFADYIHPDDKKRTLAVIEKAIMEKRTERGLTNRQRTKSGFKVVEWYGTPFFDEQGNYIGFQASGRDITEREKAELELKKNEEKVSAILQSVPDHMSMMDKDLNIVWANDVAKRIFGEDIIGKKCYTVYHGRKEPCEPYPCLTLKTFQDGKIHEHDTQVTDKDGKIIYFHCTANVALRDEEGKPQAVLEISRDITENKKAEEELKKRFHQLEVFHKAAVDRELKMKQLEERIKKLEAERGKKT